MGWISAMQRYFQHLDGPIQSTTSRSPVPVTRATFNTSTVRFRDLNGLEYYLGLYGFQHLNGPIQSSGRASGLSKAASTFNTSTVRFRASMSLYVKQSPSIFQHHNGLIQSLPDLMRKGIDNTFQHHDGSIQSPARTPAVPPV